ncbi:MAG: septal ring lytic transglycosylase RlpA family protein [Candidatus Acidiferrum sp.]
MRASARIAANVLIFATLALALAGLAGCSAQNPRSDFSYPSAQSWALHAPYHQGGNPAIAPRVEVASWYGPGFQGHPTSTGERFNEYGLSAASKTLPLGSTVRVTNPANGRSVDVRINDRGPFVHGRSIDLSKGAAQRLGMTAAGVAPVLVASPGATATPISSSPRSSVIATACAPAARDEQPSRCSEPRAATRSSWLHPHPHRTYRVAHAYHSRRHRRRVWNPVGAWIESSLSTL